MMTATVLTREKDGALTSYYGDAADDYYAKDSEATAWQGKAADELKLSGPVDQRDFQMMLDGHLALGTYARTASNRHDSKERMGIDLTFSAPKSVSLQALVGGDARIIEAHDKAVERAVARAEELAQARRKENGRSATETTGNLAVAKFRHETSREQDPQLHTHAVVMNFTKRRDGEWRALKNDEIVKSTKLIGAIYRAELAHELTRLGYELRHGRDGLFELAHISREQIEAFSQRIRQVDQALADRGLDRVHSTAPQRRLAALESRKRKVSIERATLYGAWRSRASELGIHFERPGIDREAGPSIGHYDASPWQAAIDADAARRAIAFAILHHTERQSVVTHDDLLKTAIEHGTGKVTERHLREEIIRRVKDGYLIAGEPAWHLADARSGKPGESRTKAGWTDELVRLGLDRREAEQRTIAAIERGRLVPTERRYTTQTALSREKSTLANEKAGRGTVTPIMDAETVRARLAGAGLKPGQERAVETMLASPDRVVGVQGLAGTGKTFMLKTAADLAKKRGYEFRAIASYGAQVKELRREGFETNTLAAFLNSKDLKIGPNSIVVLDEAGVVPSRLMDRFLQVTRDAGARVVLTGDTGQTKAIEAGRPFDQLQAAGMRTALMDDIQRQKPRELREAVRLAAFGEARAALELIERGGFQVREIQDDEARYSTIAADYANLAGTAKERADTLIVTMTNEAREMLNAEVRDTLGLSGAGRDFSTLVRVDTTQAERRHGRYYRKDQVLQPEKDYPRFGLARGELYTVKDAPADNRLTVEAADGRRITFNPAHVKKLSVYKQTELEFAVGDTVRVTRNEARLDLTNGDIFEVVGIKKDGRDQSVAITLDNGKRQVVLDAAQRLHLDHGYTATAHGIQGSTATRTLFDADTRPRPLTKETFYVGISRATTDVRIYTDRRNKLPEAIARPTEKHAALDLVKSRQQQRRQGPEAAREAGAAAPPTPAKPPRQRERDAGRER